MNLRILLTSFILIGVLLAVAPMVLTQSTHEHGNKEPGGMKMEGPGSQAGAAKKTPVHVSSEELHQSGGVPKGWSFSLPGGNPEAGRQVFVELECFKCHQISGENFPNASRGEGDVGPELTGMGPFHPAEYFAESIINPNAVIITGQGYTGADGLSIMPNYNDSLTLRQLIDLVAYLKSIGGEGHPQHQAEGHGQHQAEEHGQHQTEEHKHQAEEHKH